MHIMGDLFFKVSLTGDSAYEEQKGRKIDSIGASYYYKKKGSNPGVVPIIETVNEMLVVLLFLLVRVLPLGVLLMA